MKFNQLSENAGIGELVITIEIAVSTKSCLLFDLWYNICINADIICSAGIYGRAKFLACAKTHMTNYIMIFLGNHDIINNKLYLHKVK